jgi:hypothetical protein
MKAIIGILNNPALSDSSHSAGMVNIVSKLFDAKIINENDDWNEFQELIIYHGPNFKEGSYNVIGGINNDILLRAKKLSQFTGIVSSLDGFQLNDFSTKRKLGLYNDFKAINRIELPKRNKIIIGDSHSVSCWPNKEYTISRNDGKTLFGYLKDPVDLSKYEHSIIYFGNIDVRFHLARQKDPIGATIELFNRYIDYAKKYNCTLVQLLPIEDESRKIPKSGQYKGVNFFGSKELRKEIRKIANGILYNSGLEVLCWPNYFINELGDLDFEYMEQKQSVHLKPRYYMNECKKQLTFF